MGTLYIKWVVTRRQWIATEYELKGFAKTTTDDVYYNVGAKRSNAGNFDMCSLWCARALIFSGMADGAKKTVESRWSKGTITNHKNNSISMNAGALQSMTYDDHLLAHMFGNANTDSTNINAARQLLPQYLLCRDLAQLNENVLFYILWGDNTPDHTGTLNGKYISVVLNLFEKQNE